jgi:uncharacterized protein YciI
MPYFTLTYEMGENFAERRMPYRGEHLALVRAAHARGDVLMAGALGTPPTGGLLIFRAPDASVVEEFAKNDPYVIQGLVTHWEVKRWTVVAGYDPAEAPANLPK